MPDEGGTVDRFALVGTVVEGRFRIDRAVAEGGFGVVYQGTQLALDRPVAIKVLKTPDHFSEEAKSQFMASFTAEARTIARINHPSIVQVYDFGLTTCPNGERAPWMALEWLTGGTLEAELHGRRGRGGRSPSEVLGLLRPVLEAFAFAHREGIAHRDIKPANIMVVDGPRGVSLRILDFGIAKIMESDELTGGSGTGRTRTRSSQIAFSPAYAAPEQISQGRTGPWTDVHALALVISEMLTDEEPFNARDMTALYAQIMHPVRPTPKAKGRTVGQWEEVLHKALAVVPAERHRDAGELLRALEACVTAASSPQIQVPSTAPKPMPAHKTTHAAVAHDAPDIPVSSAPKGALIAIGAVVVLGAATFALWPKPNKVEGPPSTGVAHAGASSVAPAAANVPEPAPGKIVELDAAIAAPGAEPPRAATKSPPRSPRVEPPPPVRADPKPAVTNRPKSARDIVE